MTDAELTVLAAKAMGNLCIEGDAVFTKSGRKWAPLENGNDNQQLQAKLRIDIRYANDKVIAMKLSETIMKVAFIETSAQNATRLAVVKVAAQLGERLK